MKTPQEIDAEAIVGLIVGTITTLFAVAVGLLIP
jgi:hypothetical protein